MSLNIVEPKQSASAAL